MGRPREFDEPAALDAAMDCFWHQGCEATSIRDLAAQMGISGTSLYNTFGDKRSLFRDVLNRYTERSTRERIARLEAALPPKEAIRTFLGEIVERSLDTDRRGCLLVNTTLEIAPHDPELGAVVAKRLGEIEAFFRRAVTAAQADGSVPPQRDPADLVSTPSEKILLSQKQPHPRADDREQTTRARQAAEALFTAKPSVSRPSVSDTPPADQSVRKPRVLRITSPPPARHDEPQSPVALAPSVREIPRSQFARIRALAKYGMTAAQVAQLYRVAVGEIKRILRRA